MRREQTPEWNQKVFVSDGKTVSGTNMWMVKKYNRLANGSFICDAEGNPLDPNATKSTLTTQSAPEVTTPVVEDIKTQETPEVKVPKTKKVEKKESEIPEDLVCPHCNAKARTESSYMKNHGDNCSMKV
jgi:hypothetical protein